MTDKAIYQAAAWPDFHECREEWMGPGPHTVIIPEYEDKGHVLRSLPYLQGTVTTIPELISTFTRYRQGRGLVSSSTVETILNHILTDSRVPYLKMEKFRHSYVRALAGFFSHFRSTSLEDLGQALGELRGGDLSLKEKDLINIYREYEKRLPGYGDDLQRGLRAFLQEEGDLLTCLGLQKEVVILGFHHFSPVEAAFIRHLFRFLPGLTLLICLEEAASEQAMRIGKTATPLVEDLKALGAAHKILPAGESFFASLANRLFGPGEGIGEPLGGEKGRVSISAANSRYQEVVSIARRIRELAAEGTSLEDIRLAAPAYPLYSLIVGEVFPEYGLPFTLDRGLPILHYPLARVIWQVVSQGISSNPYPLREKVLASPYVQFSHEVTPARLAAYQASCGVEMVKDNELVSLVRPGHCSLDFSFVRNLRQESYQYVKPLPGVSPLEVAKRYLQGMYGDHPEELSRRLTHCLAQLYLVVRAEEVLTRWPARLSGSDFAGTLLGILGRFQIGEDLGGAGLEVKERDQAIFARVQRLLADMEGLAPGKDGGTYSFPELARHFVRLLEEASLGREEYDRGDGGVRVQPAEAGQYGLWPHTFACGLVDGEFPPMEDFNFLEPKKEGLALGQNYTRVDHGRNDFYHLVRSTGKALHISRPLSDNGKRLAASPFIRELQKWLPGEEESDPEAGGQERLYSLREKLFFIGREVDRDYHRAVPLLRELKEANPEYLSRILGILRFDGLTLASRFSEYDGLISPGQGVSPSLTMLGEEIRAKEFTPRDLERYAACPLRYFFDDILNLRQRPDYDPDTTEAALLIRSLLHTYTTEACSTRGVPAGAESLFLAELAACRQEQEEQGLDAFQNRFLNSLAAGLGDEAPRRRGLLKTFLRHETEGPDFLTPARGSLTGVLDLGDGLKVRVQVDRVDRAGDTGYLLAFLYTLAGEGGGYRIARGLRFDLPLAVLLCRQLITEENLEDKAGGAGLYQVRSPGALRRSGYFALENIRATRRDGTSPRLPVFSGSRTGFLDEVRFNEALHKIQEQILRLNRLMARGIFHLPLCYAAEQSCHTCTFNRLCRKEQLRLEKIRKLWLGQIPGEEEGHLVRDIL